jgi:hypothetical protein
MRIRTIRTLSKSQQTEEQIGGCSALQMHLLWPSTNYEKSEHHFEGVQVMKLGAPPAEDASIPIYRLREDVAKRLRLLPEWSPGSAWSPEHAKPEHRERAKSLGLDLSSAMSFTQPWDWQPPANIS